MQVFSLKNYTAKLRVSHVVLLYATIRILSFLTYGHSLPNSTIAGILIVGFVYLCIKNIPLAWTVLLVELFIGGSGHFFEFKGFIVRTWFLGIFALVWALSKLKQRRFPIPHDRHLFIGVVATLLVIAWSAINGFLQGHETMLILQDAILYLFLLLLFPALDIDIREKIKELHPIFIKGFVLGSTLFSIMTLFIYSSGIGTLPDRYYHWFRNIAAGKITDLGSNMFRIVLPEHIFVIPIFLIFVAKLIHKKEKNVLWWYTLCSAAVLALNFTRIYFVAIAVGFLFLYVKTKWIHWFKISFMAGMSILLLFSSFFFIASRGQSFGYEVLLGRATGVVSPFSETSGATRMALLPNILGTIQEHPWFGSGLGATVTYIDPLDNIQKNRTQFDWGYFEMIAELGIVGLLVFLGFLGSLLFKFAQFAYKDSEPIYKGLLAGATTLFVINITTPALFYGFGILYFVLLITVIHNAKRGPA